MNPIYQSALDGTLKSTVGSSTDSKIVFTNKTPIALYAAWITPEGKIDIQHMLKPGLSGSFDKSRAGYAYLFLTEDSGAFVSAHVQQNAGGESIAIAGSMLCRPNDIGLRPEPSKSSPIPTDSQAVVVGIGIIKASSPLISVCRQQFWRLSPDSYTLAPGQKRTVSFQETSGMQQTSSSQSSVSDSLGIGASAGWGPISVSVSASLSRSSSKMQQVVVSNETIRFESVSLENATSDTVMFLNWQLTDVITVFKDLKPVASIISLVRPVLTSQAYNPNKLPEPKEFVAPKSFPVPQFSLGGNKKAKVGVATKRAKR